MQYVLRAQSGTLKGLVFVLDEDQDHWLLGRDPKESDFLLEDALLSRTVGRIVKQNDYYYFEAHPSTTVLLNGVPIEEKALLQPKDQLQIGGTQFIFDLQAGQEEAPVPPPQPKKTTRWVVKVMTGPNKGAELALDPGHDYIVGSDALACDIVLQDMTVSPQHAEITVGDDQSLQIQDLGSENGTQIKNQAIQGSVVIDNTTTLNLGTTTLMIIDTTQANSVLLTEEKGSMAGAPQEESVVVRTRSKSTMSFVAIFLGAVVSLVIMGALSLMITTTPSQPQVTKENLQEVIAKFPGVKYTFVPGSGALMLFGHVSTALEKNELCYYLQHDPRIQTIDDHIVVDEAIWQEINIVLAKKPEFQGVSMHSPQPGEFVLTGYLKTKKQATALMEYMNLYFNYVNLLHNRVYIEDYILDEVQTVMEQNQFPGLDVSFLGGELILKGTISTVDIERFEQVLDLVRGIEGIRLIKDFIMALSPEQTIIDLNEKYPGKYRITGFSKYDNVNINVVINDRILARGDSIDGMRVINIQPNVIFLEKDGLKYKIEFYK